jgi:multiple sugar transport system substrate-binding protein
MFAKNIHAILPDQEARDIRMEREWGDAPLQQAEPAQQVPVSRRNWLGRVTALAAALPVFGLGACVPGQGQGAGQSASKAPVTVTFFSRSAEEEAFTKRVPQFMEKHPNIRLDYNALPGDYLQVIRTHAAAGTLADAVYMQNLLFEGLAAGGSIQAIDKLVQRDKVDLKQWYEGGVNALKMDGKLFGLPARGQIGYCFLFYNRDAMTQAGVREPTEAWSLDDLVAAAEKLTVRDGSRFGYNTQWGNFQHTLAAIRRWGGDLLSPDGKKCTADSPQALQAIQWHWELWHRRQVMSTKPFSAADFGNGSNIMAGQMLAGARSDLKNASKDAFKWSMVLMPKGPTGKIGAELSVAPTGLSSQSKVSDGAWEVVKFFTDKETGVQLGLQTRGSNTPGMRRDVYCDERLLADASYPREMLDRVCKAMDNASTITYSVAHNFRQTEVNQVVTKHMNAIRDNAVAPSAATMRTMTTEVQAVLDLPRG